MTPDALPFNVARYVFLDPRAKDFFVDWERMADDIASALRIEAGKTGDQALSRLVGDLATGSASFATRWARHDVRLHVTRTKRLRHPLIEEIELTGDALYLAGEGLTLIAYTAEAGTRAQEQLDFLISWAFNLIVQRQRPTRTSRDDEARSPERPVQLTPR